MRTNDLERVPERDLVGFCEGLGDRVSGHEQDRWTLSSGSCGLFSALLRSTLSEGVQHITPVADTQGLRDPAPYLA